MKEALIKMDIINILAQILKDNYKNSEENALQLINSFGST